MKPFRTVILGLFVLFSCKGKEGGQQNLNKPIGWKPDQIEDYIMVIVKLNDSTTDSASLAQKRVLDFAILETLNQEGVGGQAENDDKSETDIAFVLPKDSNHYVQVISSIIMKYGYFDRVTLWQRHYDSSGKWTDRVLSER